MGMCAGEAMPLLGPDGPLPDRKNKHHVSCQCSLAAFVLINKDSLFIQYALSNLHIKVICRL